MRETGQWKFDTKMIKNKKFMNCLTLVKLKLATLWRNLQAPLQFALYITLLLFTMHFFII